MFTALLDACVLYPAPLRDFLMRLAVRLYQPKWTKQIHEEWIESLLENRPDIGRAALERTRELMDRFGGDCLVMRYKWLIPALSLPDPDDRHVLAAAIASKANYLVTFNLADFPSTVLSPYDIEAVHPDEFALRLFKLDDTQFLSQVSRHRQSLISPPKTVDQYLATLVACGLNETAELLRSYETEI